MSKYVALCLRHCGVLKHVIVFIMLAICSPVHYQLFLTLEQNPSSTCCMKGWWSCRAPNHGSEASPHPTGTHPTFMVLSIPLLRNCNGLTSRGLSLFSHHYALEIISTRGAPMSVPVPVLLPPNVPNGWNLGQRLMPFSSQDGKSF